VNGFVHTVMGLLPLIFLGLYLLPAIMCTRRVVRNGHTKVWLLVFLSVPLLGPLCYVLSDGKSDRR
jgi:hypothetical protein